ncbi:MAG: hypothetical protein ACHQ7M_02220 [Chloroflexota bacterium]
MTLTPFLLRAVAIAGGLSLAVAGGFAAYGSLSGAGAAPNQGLMVPVAFTDASGQHAILADSGRPAELQAGQILHDRTMPNVEAAEQVTPVAAAPAPPVMTAPDTAAAAAAAAPANLAPPAPAVTIVRTAPGPVVVHVREADRHSAQVVREDEHSSKQNHSAEHASKHREGGD